MLVPGPGTKPDLLDIQKADQMKRSLKIFAAIFIGTLLLFVGRGLFVSGVVWPLPIKGLLSFAALLGVVGTFLEWWLLGGSPSPTKQKEAETLPEVRTADRLKRIAEKEYLEKRNASVHAPSHPALLEASKQLEVPADIRAVSKQAILFRQDFPPRHDNSWLSFWGGVPLAPRGFAWPSEKDAQGTLKPLSFLMQIDCAAIPKQARLGLLPDSGVIYFFLDLVWGEGNGFRVIYDENAAAQPLAVAMPQNLPQLFGAEAKWLWKWAQSQADCPKLFPKWTFKPVMIDVPEPTPDPDDEGAEDASLIWPGEHDLKQAMLAAQGAPAVQSNNTYGSGTDRPFADFPQDWQAVRITAGLALNRVRDKFNSRELDPEKKLSPEALEEKKQRILVAAQAWYDKASAQPPFAIVPSADAETFWAWLSESDVNRPLIYFGRDAEQLSIEASLTASPEAAARIPKSVLAKHHARHALAGTYEDGKVFSHTPDRMLAAHSFVQGNELERAQTHLLLLEMSSNEGLDHHFGEGVYQFWITPDDLKARRFDKVELTTTAY